MKHLYRILTICLLYCGSIRSQSALYIDSVLVYEDTVILNSTDLYVVQLRNAGPVAYTGTLSVMYAVDSAGTGTQLSLLDSSFVFLVGFDTGMVHLDSSLVTIDQRFRSGINTVVIWPRSSDPSFITKDSIRVAVFVSGVAGVHERALQTLSWYPNPAQQEILIVNRDDENRIEQVRIWTMDGRLLLTQRGGPRVNLANLASGAYLIEFLSANGKSARYRFIRQ